MSFTIINKSSDLDYLDKELLLKSVVGVDTEFRRRSKDDIDLALIQINDGHEIFLVDCISIGTYLGACKFLTEKKVLKIFHSCREDIEVLFSWTKEEPKNIFDTQLANAFLGGSFSIGYQKIVEKELGVHLEKDETRSNWIKRPLRDSQLRYAASDVQFLLDLYEIQSNKLNKLRRLEWMNEEISSLIRKQESEEYKEFNRINKVSKSQEKEFLYTLNEIVLEVSETLEINKTLLLSKKEQREVLSRILYRGVEETVTDLLNWKRDLLQKDIYDLVDRFNLGG
tara:strand:- start:2140 stop:2988 length:849 start_codon:yes stop_codon:yes gene_type:complete